MSEGIDHDLINDIKVHRGRYMIAVFMARISEDPKSTKTTIESAAKALSVNKVEQDRIINFYFALIDYYTRWPTAEIILPPVHFEPETMGGLIDAHTRLIRDAIRERTNGG